MNGSPNTEFPEQLTPTRSLHNVAVRIVLISPKGPLYRHRGGIFGQALRYKPLTLHLLRRHSA